MVQKNVQFFNYRYLKNLAYFTISIGVFVNKTYLNIENIQTFELPENFCNLK